VREDYGMLLQVHYVAITQDKDWSKLGLGRVREAGFDEESILDDGSNGL
jgi:hypothetical protein